jgi:hypothetical protein
MHSFHVQMCEYKIVEVKKAVSVDAMKASRGSRGIAPLIFELKIVVSG